MFEDTPYSDSPWASNHKNREILVNKIFNSFVNFKGKTVLDLGCLDGRFSFAALKSGAKFVVGVDVRKQNIEKAKEFSKILKLQNVFYENYDCNEYLSSIVKEKKKFDIVMCLGLFYHVCEFVELSSLMKKVKNEIIIIETLINGIGTNKPCLIFRKESRQSEDSSYSNDGYSFIPNKKVIHELYPSNNYNVAELEGYASDRPIFFISSKNKKGK